MISNSNTALWSVGLVYCSIQVLRRHCFVNGRLAKLTQLNRDSWGSQHAKHCEWNWQHLYAPPAVVGRIPHASGGTYNHHVAKRLKFVHLLQTTKSNLKIMHAWTCTAQLTKYSFIYCLRKYHEHFRYRVRSTFFLYVFRGSSTQDSFRFWMSLNTRCMWLIQFLWISFIASPLLAQANRASNAIVNLRNRLRAALLRSISDQNLHLASAVQIVARPHAKILVTNWHARSQHFGKILSNQNLFLIF